MSNDANTNEEIRALYELHANDIYRFARFTMGSSTEAYDVVQEVFLRAIRSWDDFRHEANPRTWLMAIARNYMYDQMKKQRVRAEGLTDFDAPYVKDDLSSVETTILLEGLLAKLKDSYRQVFVLRHIEQLSIQESAKILGWSEGQVRTTDHRAVAKLREWLGVNHEEVTTSNEV